METYRYEISNHFSNSDWLDIYSTAILEHDLDGNQFKNSETDPYDHQLLLKQAEYARWIS